MLGVRHAKFHSKSFCDTFQDIEMENMTGGCVLFLQSTKAKYRLLMVFAEHNLKKSGMIWKNELVKPNLDTLSFTLRGIYEW